MSRRRLLASVAFAALTVLASILLGRRLTHSSWPLDHVEPWLAAAAALAYLGSFFFRARAWNRLFPADECPGQARCLASVGAAAASGAVLPFRLDYLIKVGVLRKLGGIRVGLGAVALSIVSLGMIDAIAMLPLSISATVTTNSVLRGPLLVVVAFGIACSTLLVVGRRLASVSVLGRRVRALGDHVALHTSPAGRRDAVVAWFYLFACWSARAFGSAALLSALGLSFSPQTALTVICLGAAAGIIPITSGGAVVNAGAAAAILLALGVAKDVAIDFSLASGLLLVISAVAASLCGVFATVAVRLAALRGPAPAGLGAR
jgi:Lysylphosphatidylglycerol synthase TM region